MSKIFYNIFTWLYPFFASLIAPFNAKAKKWLSGRKDIFETIEHALDKDSRPVIWMHCASLGEFEQGRPLLEELRANYPSYAIVLTFFSPSGYEVQKGYKGADYIFYLPMDNETNARRFLDLVNPALVIFIKYEFWYYYLTEIKKRNIPCLLVSAIFRRNQPFFKWYGGFHQEMLACFTYCFVQNEESLQLLNGIGYTATYLAGDTRFDRVIQIAERFEPIESIAAFCGDAKVIVAGSTWTEDDKELDHFANTRPDVRFIIAPHNIGEDRLKECLQLYKSAVLYSEWIKSANTSPSSFNTLIIDNIGMLSRLYHYATIAFIGGGFGAEGIHNALEAAVYSKAVVFGPVYDKYAEAIELVEKGGAFPVNDALELEKKLSELLNNAAAYNNACHVAGAYVAAKTGATKKIIQFIHANRLLTN
ncbi:MAG: 3-deoxy-D-manno-octulosonic acid transferase [Filimonas sp.]|nr:3-deoxy-D-manno-octulosonic acid transferase [Filimonas sp.]